MRRALALAIMLALAATAALAQAPQRQPELWRNAGGVPPEDATPRLNPGEHGVGDVIAEIDVMPPRVGHLASDVSLTDPRYGTLTLAAHTPLRAYAMRYISYNNQVRDAGAQWCTITNGANIICVSFIGPRIDHASPPPEQAFLYQEYTPNLAEATRRSWQGPEPIIEEDPPDPTPVRRQIVIRSITARGVTFSSNEVKGAEIVAGPMSEPLRYGARPIMDQDFMPYGFAVTRIRDAGDRVLVTIASVAR